MELNICHFHYIVLLIRKTSDIDPITNIKHIPGSVMKSDVQSSDSPQFPEPPVFIGQLEKPRENYLPSHTLW